MEEIWKDIKGYECRYQVSNLGNVKSLEHYHKVLIHGKPTLRHRKEQILKQWKRSSYLLVDLWKEDKRDVRSVHILVYEAFVGVIEDGLIIHHIDENKSNNRIDNLECMSVLEHNRLHLLKPVHEISTKNKNKTIIGYIKREIWNKGIKYGESEFYKRSHDSRTKNIILRAKETYELFMETKNCKSVSEKFGITKRTVYYRVKQYEDFLNNREYKPVKQCSREIKNAS